jgi:transcriptional regulator with XRE-family HTH domain
MEFARVLKKLRTKSGKSRYELSKLTALDQAFLGRLETGEKNPSRDTVLKLGFALVHNNSMISMSSSWLLNLLHSGNCSPGRRHISLVLGVDLLSIVPFSVVS